MVATGNIKIGYGGLIGHRIQFICRNHLMRKKYFVFVAKVI